MVRVLLEHGRRLYREAFSAAMSSEPDLDVVCDVARIDQVLPAALQYRPDVAVLSPLPGEISGAALCRLPGEAPAECALLMVLDRQAQHGPGRRLARMAPRVGILAADSSVEDLVTGVRCLARGEPVLDLEVAVAALSAQANPLTGRECEILRFVMTGATTLDVAESLGLSAGTVRNYLSQITVKTGARSRIEAIRIAQDAGWI